MVTGYRVDPETGAQIPVQFEEGIPGDYVGRGATTVQQYQQMAAADLSDKQIQAQREIANQQQGFNEKQVNLQNEQVEQQKRQAQEQADRQSTYDAGRNRQFNEGTNAINNAFARFTNNDEVFDRYRKDYMTKALDDINYQRTQATKDLGFQLARQGISSSQAGVNQTGLIQETSGRAGDVQTANAQTSADQLRNAILSSKQNLLDQLSATQSIGSPIAGSTNEAVNSALQTQRNAISGLQSTAGDVVANVNAVPTVNTLGNIFAGILGAGASTLSGLQAGDIRGQFSRGFAGTNPGGTGSTRFS
jgi:hypothetical protein